MQEAMQVTDRDIDIMDNLRFAREHLVAAVNLMLPVCKPQQIRNLRAVIRGIEAVGRWFLSPHMDRGSTQVRVQVTERKRRGSLLWRMYRTWRFRCRVIAVDGGAK